MSLSWEVDIDCLRADGSRFEDQPRTERLAADGKHLEKLLSPLDGWCQQKLFGLSGVKYKNIIDKIYQYYYYDGNSIYA